MSLVCVCRLEETASSEETAVKVCSHDQGDGDEGNIVEEQDNRRSSSCAGNIQGRWMLGKASMSDQMRIHLLKPVVCGVKTSAERMHRFIQRCLLQQSTQSSLDNESLDKLSEDLIWSKFLCAYDVNHRGGCASLMSAMRDVESAFRHRIGLESLSSCVDSTQMIICQLAGLLEICNSKFQLRGPRILLWLEAFTEAMESEFQKNKRNALGESAWFRELGKVIKETCQREPVLDFTRLVSFVCEDPLWASAMASHQSASALAVLADQASLCRASEKVKEMWRDERAKEVEMRLRELGLVYTKETQLMTYGSLLRVVYSLVSAAVDSKGYAPARRIQTARRIPTWNTLLDRAQLGLSKNLMDGARRVASVLFEAENRLRRRLQIETLVEPFSSDNPKGENDLLIFSVVRLAELCKCSGRRGCDVLHKMKTLLDGFNSTSFFVWKIKQLIRKANSRNWNQVSSHLDPILREILELDNTKDISERKWMQDHNYAMSQ